MRYLLDTHIILWAANGTLAQKTRGVVEEIMGNSENQLFFSAVNIWEIELKKDRLNEDPQTIYKALLANGYEELPVNGRAAIGVGRLANIHKDPFDRMLIAQAVEEGVAFVTADKLLAGYGPNVQEVSR
jgi:PIN domain nuclease of toxin-antitoxin system